MSHIFVPSDDAEASSGLLGGKAASLLRLHQAGLPVPDWLCVTTAAFRSLVEPLKGPLEARLKDLKAHPQEAIPELSGEVRRIITEATVPPAVAEPLAQAAARLFPGETLLAVRSSAVGEDSATDSFAGQMDSYLFVRQEGLLHKVKECFASAFSARALLYRRLRGQDPLEVEAAVVVQRMVDSRVSGILFTANPTTSNREEMVIAASWGLGEGVVGDLVETDTWFYDRVGDRMLTGRIGQKTERVAFHQEEGTGTHLQPVPEAEHEIPALTDAQLRELVEMGARVEEHYGCPQDIEWAIGADGRLQLTQSRPITTLDAGRMRIFDNSNIIEGYPGVTTPLTFSFARYGYEVTFRKTAEAFGVSPRTIAREQATFAHMVALIDGRMYYDLLNWYRLYEVIPGMERNLPAWEAALGLPTRYRPEPSRRPLRERWRRGWGRFRLNLKLLEMFTLHGVRVASLERAFRRIYGDFQDRDFEGMEANQLVDAFEELLTDLLSRWGITTVNDFFTFQLYDRLGKVIETLDADLGLRNDLLCGEQGMESVEPVTSTLRLAARVREAPELRVLFESDRGDRAIWDQLQAAGEGPLEALKAAMDEHLRRYGDRTTHELMLETPSLSDRPEYLVNVLRNYLRAGREMGHLESREQSIRQQAEARAAQALKGQPLKRWLFRFLLKHTRRTVRNRENMRMMRTRAFGLVKRIFRRLGAIFAREGFIEAADDIFYLTHQEIIGFVRGGAVCRSLRALVALRTEEFVGYREREPAARIVVRGVAYRRPFELAVPEEVAAGADGVLTGMGCSQGTVRGTARVITDPTRALQLNGEILVAPMTDPGWVFLMVAASGLVVERGSMLSHTAIIGRELGIPTVVAVAGATRRIKDGQQIEMDGERGIVRVLDGSDGGPEAAVASE